MIGQNVALPRKGMLKRERICELIAEGLNYPLLAILAAPGYGKTQAMADYFEGSDARVIWVRLNALDNLYSHFWSSLFDALRYGFPALSEALQVLGYPSDPYSLDSFFNVISAEFSKESRVVWIFDDFGEIKDSLLYDFFALWAKMEIPGLCLVLISNVITSADAVAFMTNRQFLILGEQLRFTKEETAALFALNNIWLDDKDLSAVERYTEGWPLALHLLARRERDTQSLLLSGKSITQSEISHMFENKFFSNYSRPKQLLLVSLSLLDFSFSKELAAALCEGDEADMLGKYAFIINEAPTEYYYFHHMYRTFLREKKSMLTPDDEKRLWRRAAEFYNRAGNLMEAAACYRKCGDHAGMLGAIVGIELFSFKITDKIAAHLLELLDLLTPEELRDNPIADAIRAFITMSLKQIEKTEEILDRLLGRLDSPAAHKFLTDVYVMYGLNRMMQAKADFGEYFKKACEYMPGMTDFSNKNMLRVYNNHSFFMSDNSPGAKERMERAVHEGVPYMIKVMDGSMTGMPELFSAEIDYLSYNLKEAEQHAYRALYQADGRQQYDIACNAYCLLARIAHMRGRFEEVTEHIGALSAYVELHDLNALKEIRDTALAWYYIKLRDFKRVPKSIFSVYDPEKPALAYGRSLIVYANYLLNTEEYAKLAGMLEQSKSKRINAVIVEQDSVCMFIMLAVSHLRLGNADSAMDAFWTAYRMCRDNGLITLFIEADRHARALIDLARRQAVYRFDEDWLADISRRANNFSKRTVSFRAAYYKQNDLKTAVKNPLSKRENEVLQGLASGLTREEIANKYYVSIHTVKSVIQSIFNKLGVGSRTEAVSIAIARKYITGYTTER
ncbi:MAG: LuxR C-terminal-related transcriptional regulator [Clostridiales bacterium]|jgi:LuxR family maltose regulon positive regulatory protein|nr:LuxR C-terminal-related transcriptional regulator [Clostridiales bacterium]